MTPTTVMNSSTLPRAPAIWRTKSWVFSRSPLARNSASTGTKACEKAPSAKRRRRKLGMRKATKKASAAALSPKRAANTVSLTKPRMRDRKVEPEVTTDERNRPFEWPELSGVEAGDGADIRSEIGRAHV